MRERKKKRPKGYNGEGVLRGFNALTSHVSFHLYDKAEKQAHNSSVNCKAIDANVFKALINQET